MISRPVAQSAVLLCGLVILSLSQGCTSVGPALYESSFDNYNDAIRKTSDGQMLANLVRMRYSESPIFLQVSSISATFGVGGNLGGSAGFNSGAADNYGVGVGANFSQTPTITFSLPESEAYYGRMLAPLSAAQVTSLVLGGFDSELALRTAVRGMNGLKNVSVDYSDSSTEPASDARFAETLALIKKLRSEGLVDMELGGKETSWSSPVTLNAKGELAQVLLLAAASYAMANDAEIVSYPNGTWQTHRYEKHMALRFAPAAKDSAEAQRLKKLLGLKSDRNNFSIVEAELVNAEKARGVLGQSPGALDPSVVWEEIGLRGRSMMEIMQVASKTVQIPEEDVKRGVAFANLSKDPKSATGGADLAIKSSKSKPSNSVLSVKYRGHWFYIEDSDLESREAFAMLNALFAIVGGTVPGAHPVLTVPVR